MVSSGQIKASISAESFGWKAARTFAREEMSERRMENMREREREREVVFTLVVRFLTFPSESKFAISK